MYKEGGKIGQDTIENNKNTCTNNNLLYYVLCIKQM